MIDHFHTFFKVSKKHGSQKGPEKVPKTALVSSIDSINKKLIKRYFFYNGIRIWKRISLRIDDLSRGATLSASESASYRKLIVDDRPRRVGGYAVGDLRCRSASLAKAPFTPRKSKNWIFLGDRLFWSTENNS